MASGPIDSWQIQVETVRDFIFGGSKVTLNGDCSHEIKRHLLLGRKAMTNLDRILRRDGKNTQKGRGTKKPLDESERREWKSWLKVQHSEN